MRTCIAVRLVQGIGVNCVFVADVHVAAAHADGRASNRDSVQVIEHAVFTGAGYVAIAGAGAGDGDDDDENQPRKEQEEKGRYLDSAGNAATLEANQISTAGMLGLPKAGGGGAAAGGTSVAPVRVAGIVLSDVVRERNGFVNSFVVFSYLCGRDVCSLLSCCAILLMGVYWRGLVALLRYLVLFGWVLVLPSSRRVVD